LEPIAVIAMLGLHTLGCGEVGNSNLFSGANYMSGMLPHTGGLLRSDAALFTYELSSRMSLNQELARIDFPVFPATQAQSHGSRSIVPAVVLASASLTQWP